MYFGVKSTPKHEFISQGFVVYIWDTLYTTKGVLHYCCGGFVQLKGQEHVNIGQLF